MTATFEKFTIETDIFTEEEETLVYNFCSLFSEQYKNIPSSDENKKAFDVYLNTETELFEKIKTSFYAFAEINEFQILSSEIVTHSLTQGICLDE